MTRACCPAVAAREMLGKPGPSRTPGRLRDRRESLPSRARSRHTTGTMRARAVLVLVAVAATQWHGATGYVIDAPLRGLEMRCCAILEPPLVQHDNTTVEHYSGIAIEYLRLLELKLGFRCASLDDYRSPSGANLTFTEAVDSLSACSAGGSVRTDDPNCKCDLGVGGWSLTEARIGKVDFVEPFAFDYYRVITHRNNTVHPVGTVFFFSAFDTSVWVCILLLVATFAFLKLFDQHMVACPPRARDRPDAPEDSPFARRISHSVENLEQVQRLKAAFSGIGLYVVGLSESKAWCKKATLRRVLLNFVIFCSVLFLAITYLANMTNALLNETRISKFKGLEYFKECKIPADEVCVTRGSGAHAFWQSAIANQNCHYQRDAPRIITKKTFDETFQAFFTYECKYMIGLGFELQEIALGSHCKEVRLTGTPFRDTGVSFILPQLSNLTDIMSNATLELRDTDVLPTPQDYLSREGNCNHKEQYSITFLKIVWFVLILILACGLVLALIACATWREIPQESDDMF